MAAGTRLQGAFLPVWRNGNRGPAAEPMVTKANRKPGEPLWPVEMERVTPAISLVDSLESYQPCFEELIDRLLRNTQPLDRPKAYVFGVSLTLPQFKQRYKTIRDPG